MWSMHSSTHVTVDCKCAMLRLDQNEAHSTRYLIQEGVANIMFINHMIVSFFLYYHDYSHCEFTCTHLFACRQDAGALFVARQNDRGCLPCC